MEVAVSFIEKIEGQENFVLTTGFEVYPAYKAGDSIFIHIVNRDDEEKNMKETHFIIIDVVHSVRHKTNKRSGTTHNPFGIFVNIGIEVYVRRFG